MARFVKNYLLPRKDLIEEMTLQIFEKYDTNRSGYLEKREVLQMLDAILANQGR